MKSLIFTDINSTIKVEFVTDLINANAQNFTVMETKGLTTAWELTNINFKQLPYTVNAFKEFAEAHDLKLVLIDYQANDSGTILKAHTGQYYGGGLGIDNV